MERLRISRKGFDWLKRKTFVECVEVKVASTVLTYILYAVAYLTL